MSAHLPDIAHPRSRMGNPDALGVRGVSRSSNRAPLSPAVERFTEPEGPLAAYRSPRKHDSNTAFSSRSGTAAAADFGGGHRAYGHAPLEMIPDGVEVVNGDPMKTRLPVFGNRAGMMSRQDDGIKSEMGVSIASSRHSFTSSQLRLDIDELEVLLRDKMKGGFAELKKKFRDNDPEQKGNVSRDALQRILVTLINRPLSSSQFKRLLVKLGLQDKHVISIGDFYASTRTTPSDEHPAWMDPVDRCRTDRSLMTASQVHAHLKQRAKQKILDVMDMMPRSDPSGAIYILKPELRGVLTRMGFTMSDAEFDKLWNKYDSDGKGTTCGEKIMKKLGIAITEMQDDKLQNLGDEAKPTTTVRRKEKDRQRSLDIELWLKNKFREGCTTMKKSFEQFDKDETGLVAHNDFLSVLATAELHLQKEHLAEFMARCGVQPTQTQIPYLEFLHRFQDRSEYGMPHKIMVNNKHRYNRARSMTMSTKTTFSALETQLMNIFQTDFLTLLGTFHKIDRLGLDILSQEEFRAAIESKFGVEMTDSQFRAMLDGVPLDEDGNVKYSEFMAQFDTKGQAESLYEKPKLKKTKRQKIPTLPENAYDSPAPMTPLPSLPSDSDCEDEYDVDVVTGTVDCGGKAPPAPAGPSGPTGEQCMIDIRPRRPISTLFQLIRGQLKADLGSLQLAFIEIDTLNTGRMSQEMLYKLMCKFPADPPISRGEIRDLWKTFIVNTDKTLNFLQFLRHFGYTQSSATFPSAKVSPPERGDKDCMIRSRKLNCARDMIQDSLRSKIDYMWTDLRRQFTGMDKSLTGCISSEEFREVLQQLCVHLSDYELNMLTKKFTMKDGRVSYFEFLKPFAIKKQVWRYGNDMLDLLKHGLSPDAVISDQEKREEAALANAAVIERLRSKLSGEWKMMRRAFKRIDTNNKGVIPLTDFKNVLKKLSGVSLTDEDVYELMSRFDRRMTGEIAYLSFLADTFSVNKNHLATPITGATPVPAAGAVTYRPPGGGVAAAMRSMSVLRASAEV